VDGPTPKEIELAKANVIKAEDTLKLRRNPAQHAQEGF